jgi:hypothetical protein
MAGISNITGEESIIFADNASFDGTERGGKLTTNGQLWIGSTASPHVVKGRLTSPLGTLSIGFSSPNITLDVTGGTTVVEKFAMQTGTTPIVPLAGIVTFSGAVVAAGANPIRTNGTAASTMTLQVQTSQAIAATDATKIGLSNFNSAQFSVDANGFVSTSATGIANTITGDSGGARSPAAGNWNIVGGPGITTSGAGSTLTINNVVFTDTTAATLAVNNGYFATAAGAYLLPAAPTQGQLVIIASDTTGAVAVTANTGQIIRLGSSITAIAGNLTSTARGDSLTLRYRATGTVWMSVSSTGNWTVN